MIARRRQFAFLLAPLFAVLSACAHEAPPPPPQAYAPAPPAPAAAPQAAAPAEPAEPAPVEQPAPPTATATPAPPPPPPPPAPEPVVAPPASDESNPQAFMDRTWRAADILGLPVAGNLTLKIGGDRRASGNAGCNSFGGPARIEGMIFTFGPLTATRKACAADIMEQEQRYLEVLARVGGWRMEQGQLFLTGSDGYDLIRFSPD